MRLALLAFPLAVWASSGCTPDRCRAGNDELSMVLRAVDLRTDDGEEVRVAVDFATGDRATLPISWAKCDGDRVLINGQDARETNQEDRTEYTLTLDGEDGEEISVELDRANEDEVVTASVQRPPRFELTAPAPGLEVSRSEPIELAWEPADEGGEMQVELQEELGGGRCIVSDEVEHDYKGQGGVRVDDTGTWTVPAGVLTNDGELRCDARYVLRRFSRGDYPEELASGGFVQAEVLRIVLFESVP
ncbi:MAG: hypothetical protein ACRBN8_15805 [Nannocystales bacterium]